MRIINCHIENFGKLNNVSIDFTEGVNSVCRPNGWGKSTLAAFIKVMFFGFENPNVRDEYNNERKRFKPWQGGVYGGNILFEAEDKKYIVTRTFGNKEKEDTFELRDGDTNIISGDYGENLGEELFKIDGASFLRTVYISQNDCMTATTDSINAKMGNLAENTDDINNYETVIKRFSDIINNMAPGRKTGSLYKLKEEIAGYQQRIKRASGVEETVENIKRKRDEQKSLYDSLKKEQNILQQKQKELSRYKDLKSKKDKYQVLVENCRKWKEKKDAAKTSFGEELPMENEIDRYIADNSRLMSIEQSMDIYRLNEKEKNQIAHYEELFENEPLDEDEIDKKIEEISDLENKRKSGNSMIINLCCIIFIIILGFVAKLAFGDKYSDVYIFIPCAVIAVLAVLFVNFIKKHDDNDEVLEELERLNKLKMSLGDYERLIEKKENYNSVKEKYLALNKKISLFMEKYNMDIDGDVSKQLLKIKSKISEYAIIEKEYENAKISLEKFEETEDIKNIDLSELKENMDSMEDVDVKLAEISSNLESIHKNIHSYNYQLEELRSTMDEVREEEVYLSQLNEKFEKDSEKLELIKLTKEMLEKAKISFTAEYMRPMLNAFCKFYEMFAGKESEKYHMDANGNLMIEELGMWRDIKFLSEGCKDHIGVCMRMALVEGMYKDEKPFVIMDDSFVNLDDEKTEAARLFLEQLSKEYQIIYFTCKK